MDRLIAHRGPDGHGSWISPDGSVGLTHRRLAIIDLTAAAAQPMHAPNGTVISYNGEIYNYRELRAAQADRWRFRSASDTEGILACYEAHGDGFLSQLRGMFAFALWDERKRRLIAARDRFGIKPFYYLLLDGVLYFASEAKALLPFLPSIETNSEALAEYLTFQYTIGDKTLFKHIHQLMPGHYLVAENGKVEVKRYWDVHYQIDWEHNAKYFEHRLRELLNESMALHLRADVPIGSYISGGINFSLMAVLAAKVDPRNRMGFHGRFTSHPGYDESNYAELAAEQSEAKLNVIDIEASDFTGRIRDVIWHIDFRSPDPARFRSLWCPNWLPGTSRWCLAGRGAMKFSAATPVT